MTQLNEVLAMSLEDRLVLVATKKHLGEQIYLALARDENAAVRRIVASSDMVAYPVTVADLLAFDENEKVRVAIAHRRMSEHAVAHLANDPSRAVRCAVLACPTLSMDDAERIVFELADVL